MPVVKSGFEASSASVKVISVLAPSSDTLLIK